MKTALGCAAVVALISTSVLGQTAPAPAPAEPVAAAPEVAADALVLPVGTEILLAMATEINSTANRAGDTFPLSVVSDVRIGDHIVIPRGTRAVGEIT